MKIFSEEKAVAYDHFMSNVTKELSSIKKERHFLIGQACEIWIGISRYEQDLRLQGFNWDTLENFFGQVITTKEVNCAPNFKVISLEDKDREKLLLKNMKKLIYIRGVRIPKLNRRSYELELLAQMDYYAYNRIRECINEFFTECVLRGDIMSMGDRIGTHVIRYFEYPENRKVLNKGMTFKYIKELKAQGKTLYSAKNPNGAPYRIYFDDDGFYFWQWYKSRKTHNQKMYTFSTYMGRPADEDKKDFLKGNSNVDEIIAFKGLSPFRKMLHLAQKTRLGETYKWNGTLFRKDWSKDYNIRGKRMERLTNEKEIDFSHLIEEDNPYGI